MDFKESGIEIQTNTHKHTHNTIAVQNHDPNQWFLDQSWSVFENSWLYTPQVDHCGSEKQRAPSQCDRHAAHIDDFHVWTMSDLYTKRNYVMTHTPEKAIFFYREYKYMANIRMDHGPRDILQFRTQTRCNTLRKMPFRSHMRPQIRSSSSLIS